jgi:hypothetical protein
MRMLQGVRRRMLLRLARACCVCECMSVTSSSLCHTKMFMTACSLLFDFGVILDSSGCIFVIIL